MAKAARKKLISISSLADVETNFRFPEGTYEAKVVSCEPGESKRSDDALINWKFEITEGPYAGKSISHKTSLGEKSLWKLKQLLEALNYEIPEDDFDLDPDEVIDSELAIQIADRTYENDKGQDVTLSDITGYAPAGAAGGGEDEPEEEEPEEKPKSKRAEKRAAAKAAAKDADEEEAAPAKGKAKPAKGKKEEPEYIATADDVNAMDQEELEALVEEHDIDVDLSAFKTLSKKRAAVIKAGGELIEA
jgi:hypothetical protein